MCFGSTPLTKNFKTIIYESHEDYQDALCKCFFTYRLKTIQAFKNIQKHSKDGDKISIMALGSGALVKLNYKNMFVCKEIMLE